MGPHRIGMDYDFNKPFFEQFRSLQIRVPKPNLHQTNFVQSEYSNFGIDFKNCYLLFGGRNNERVYFGNQVLESRDSMDICFSENMEFSYEVFECQRSNHLYFSHHSQDCLESSYLIDCKNCTSCFGCVGLRNKQYCIWNEQYTKEQYKEFINSEGMGSYASHLKFKQKLHELELAYIHRYARIFKSIDSDGDDLYESRNTHMAFTSNEAQDSKYLYFVRSKVQDCYDSCFQVSNIEKVYEVGHGFGGSDVAFGMRNLFNQNARYNEECHNCSNIFGCEGLRKKNYCILNKQYTKEEYEDLVPKIIKHMKDMPYIDGKGNTYAYGEFFPADFSPFAYNESIAQEYFPLSKDQALSCGYIWKDVDARNYKVALQSVDIPDNIQNATDDLIDQVISCAHGGVCTDQCTEVFKILKEELAFYREKNLPLPRLCPNCRHYQRLSQRNPLKLWSRVCMCDKKNHEHGDVACEVGFNTIYAPDRPEIVYCEKCYQQEVV
jgi:hypothetical protein